MPKYVVMYEDERQDQENLTAELRSGHAEHLKRLCLQGKVLSCGPLKSSGYCRGKGLLIFEADSQDEVEACVLKDPFIVSKWYAGYHIYEWVEANEGNNYLIG